jgi:hypothetical protein
LEWNTLMKINEFLDEQQLDEVPAGMLGQMGKKLGAKVLSKVPGGAAKSKAANLAGQADLGDTANLLHKEFNQYLGRQGKTMKQATGEDLAAFIKSKNAPMPKVPGGVLQKPQLDAVLMQVAKDAMSGKTVSGGEQPAQAAPAAQQDANKDGKDDKTGKPIAKQAAKPGAAPKQQATATKIPPKLQQQLSALTANEKKQLVGLLQK